MENTNPSSVAPIPTIKDYNLNLRGIGDLMRDAIKTYKNNWKKFVTLMLLGFLSSVPYLVLTMIVGVEGKDISALWFLLIFVLFLVTFYFSVRIQAAILFIIKDEKLTWKLAFIAGRKYFWRIVGLTLLTFLFIFLWSLLFIIPGLIFAIFYCLASYILINEDLGGRKAIKRSRQLIKGFWWAVFARLLLLFLILFIVMMILSIPTALLNMVAVWLGSAYAILVNLVIMMITPAIMVYMFLIYKDLKTIKDTPVTIK